MSISKILGKKRKLGIKGFTIVEILIVLVVLGVIAAAVVPILANQKMKGYKKEAIDHLDVVKAAMGVYYQTNTTNPNSYTGATFTLIDYNPNTAAAGQVPNFTYTLDATSATTWNCVAAGAVAPLVAGDTGTLSCTATGYTLVGAGKLV